MLGSVSLYLGHSVGAAASVIATSETIDADAFVLIASPVVMAQTTEATAHNVGLGQTATEALLKEIRRKVGIQPRNLDLAPSLDRRAAPAIIVHDRGDRQVPIREADEFSAAWPNAQFRATGRLGRNRILQDAKVLNEITQFVASR